MYRCSGKVSTFKRSSFRHWVYASKHRKVHDANGWLAGRALLSHTLSPLPEIIYGEQGKPAFALGNAAMVQLKP